MSRIVEMDLEDGGAIRIEVDEHPSMGKRPVAVEDAAVTRLEQKFDDAIDSVRGCAMAVVKKLTTLDVTPHEVQVEFGVKVSAEGSAFVAKVGGEAHLKVSLTWRPRSKRTPKEQ